MKYILYARKSSESEERQVQSIDDQITTLKEKAKLLNLDIVEVLSEAKSAKKPDNRPEFKKMLNLIKNNTADGILCWQINRLSRNPIDSGSIQWLLQQGILKSIFTYDREYRPEDNTLVFSVESGMASQFLLDLSKNVKRGLKGRAERGWYPTNPPSGYKTEPKEHTIIKDPDQFKLIRQAWDLMLTGNYSVPQILNKLNEWGFKTVKHKRLGGNPLAMSSLYKIFSNKFYAGYFDYNGTEYQGKHEPMISLSEYDYVQFLLGKKGKPRPRIYNYAYTGMIKCGECGSMITAETKHKHIKSTGEIRDYLYYHCTKKKKDTKCQQECITNNVLEALIDNELSKYTILPEFKDWAIEILKENNAAEMLDRQTIHDNQKKALESAQSQLDKLLNMKLNDLLSDQEYKEKKENLLKEKQKLQENINHIELRADNWMSIAEKTFDFAVNARKTFANGNSQTKKQIFAALGQNFILKDKKLQISANEWLVPILEGYPAIEKEYNRLEPEKMSLDKAKSSAIAPLLTEWQGSKEKNSTRSKIYPFKSKILLSEVPDM